MEIGKDLGYLAHQVLTNCPPDTPVSSYNHEQIAARQQCEDSALEAIQANQGMGCESVVPGLKVAVLGLAFIARNELARNLANKFTWNKADIVLNFLVPLAKPEDDAKSH